MKNLTQWAAKWGVPQPALDELYKDLGTLPGDYTPELKGNRRSEAYVSSAVRLEATGKGLKLWRNNVGAGELTNGNFIRWGLANDTKQVNKVCKSSDLIGIRTIVVGPELVGCRLGIFVARETKPEGWVYTGTERERAQLAFLALAYSMGADAGFCNSVGSL